MSTAIANQPGELVAAEPGTRTKWIYSARTDQLLAWSWLPLFALTAGLSIPGTEGFDRATVALMSWVFLVSLLHQPLTLLLVYGDSAQFKLRRTLFVWTPLIAIPVIALAVVLDLWIVIPIAAIWQLYHTQQQRYGLMRIYSKKSGYGSATLDRAVSYLPLAAVITMLAVLPVTRSQLERFSEGLGDSNTHEVNLLLQHGSVMLWAVLPLSVAAVGVLVRYARQETVAYRNHQANPAKWNYLTSSFVLMAALLINPVAGLVSYITAHAIEYVVVVYRTLISRYDGKPGRSLMSFLAGSPTRRVLLVIGFFTIFGIIDLQLEGVLDAHVYLIIVYSIGLLHFLYDGFIWKTRKAAVASDFGITAGSTT